MNSEHRWAAWSGVLMALAVSMAFYGEDWIRFGKMVGHDLAGKTDGRAGAVQAAPAGTQARIPPGTSACPQAMPRGRTPTAASAKSPAPDGSAAQAGPPASPDRRDPGRGKTARETPGGGGVRVSPGPVRDGEDGLAMGIDGPGRSREPHVLHPYVYWNKEILGRTEESMQDFVEEGKGAGAYSLYQSVRRESSDFAIDLSLRIPEEEQVGKTAVIFTQRIPPGWRFKGNQGCSGWCFEKDGVVKFLARPEEECERIDVRFVFQGEDAPFKAGRIEQATCAVQSAEGSRRLCSSVNL